MFILWHKLSSAGQKTDQKIEKKCVLIHWRVYEVNEIFKI